MSSALSSGFNFKADGDAGQEFHSGGIGHRAGVGGSQAA